MVFPSSCKTLTKLIVLIKCQLIMQKIRRNWEISKVMNSKAPLYFGQWH